MNKANSDAQSIAKTQAQQVMTQNDNFTNITWYGAGMYVWRRGKVAGLFIDGAVSIQVPQSGKENGRIPSRARPQQNSRGVLACDAFPNYGGTFVVFANGNMQWAGSSAISVGVYPSLNMSWPVK